MSEFQEFIGKALVITASGGTEVFSLVNDHTVPAPKVGEVVIKVSS